MKTDLVLEAQNLNPSNKSQKIYKRVYNERIGGTIPVWESRPSVLAKEANPTPQPAKQGGDFAKALLDADEKNFSKQAIAVNTEEEFGFGDLIDIINPLQHIPLVSSAYRALTGDEIKTSSKLIGGAAFGGPLGVAGALVDTVIEQETGKGLIAHAFGGPLQTNAKPASPTKPQDPETALSLAYDAPEQSDIARTLLSFADLGHNETGIRIEKVAFTDERTAGATRSYASFVPEKVAKPAREAITQLTMRDMPPKPHYND